MTDATKQKPNIRRVTQFAQSRLFTIEKVELEFSNGEQAEFERIQPNAGRAVMVAAMTEYDEIVLVREYAVGTERYELQLPKGIVEANENSLQAANRELAEETGLAAREVNLIQTLRVSPGYFNHETDLVLATGLYPQQLDSGDEPEPLEVVKYPLDQLETLLARDDFSEARSIAGLLLAVRSWQRGRA